METSLSQDVNRFDFNDPINAYSNYSAYNVDSLPSPSPPDGDSPSDDMFSQGFEVIAIQ